VPKIGLTRKKRIGPLQLKQVVPTLAYSGKQNLIRARVEPCHAGPGRRLSHIRQSIKVLRDIHHNIPAYQEGQHLQLAEQNAVLRVCLPRGVGVLELPCYIVEVGLDDSPPLPLADMIEEQRVRHEIVEVGKDHARDGDRGGHKFLEPLLSGICDGVDLPIWNLILQFPFSLDESLGLKLRQPSIQRAYADANEVLEVVSLDVLFQLVTMHRAAHEQAQDDDVDLVLHHFSTLISTLIIVQCELLFDDIAFG